MSDTNIEWADATWNIVTGCTKHSEGCKNCYAEKMHKRLTAMGQTKYKDPFEKVTFHTEELGRLFGKNKKIFVNSMSDTFHKDITDLEIGYILTACQIQPLNTFQVLTKRAERLPNFEYPKNVWLGVSVESAQHKNRIDYLKQTDAYVKFLSCEPLLGDLGELDLRGIDWVIAGGESGHNARPVHPDWVRNIQEQCKAQGVAFFFKQWGEWAPAELIISAYNFDRKYAMTMFDDAHNQYTHGPYPFERLGKVHIWPDREFIDKPPHLTGMANYVSSRVGKHRAGSQLDGKEYKEYPYRIMVQKGTSCGISEILPNILAIGGCANE